jgi:3-phosphoshikimate 1-carboxyvinyltransferase
MLLEVYPLKSFAGTFRIPSSKPETQRAILTSTLAEGTSRVFNDLRCDETETMKQACRALGAEIVEHEDHLVIHGIGRSPRSTHRVIDAFGSGLVFRTLTALSSVQPWPAVITGDSTLCGRVMAPLFDALRELGADIESICKPGHAPIVNWGKGLRGGKCHLPGDVSSQFITAILLAAPLAESPVEIEVTSEVFSKSYIRQTLISLEQAGVNVTASADYRQFRVEPGAYRPHDTHITEDYTSASYLLAAATLYRGRSVFTNVHGNSAQGEAAIIGMLERFGVKVTSHADTHTLVVENTRGGPAGDIEIDASDCPNIVPTLAAIGAYVDGTLRVVGGRVTRFHKAPRIQAMVTELSKVGVAIKPLYDGDVCDGFEVRGAPIYAGGVRFSDWGDHRIFMSLFVASLRMRSASVLPGSDGVRLSFPEFFTEFGKAGVVTSTSSTSTNESHAGVVTAPVMHRESATNP